MVAGLMAEWPVQERLRVDADLLLGREKLLQARLGRALGHFGAGGGGALGHDEALESSTSQPALRSQLLAALRPAVEEFKSATSVDQQRWQSPSPAQQPAGLGLAQVRQEPLQHQPRQQPQLQQLQQQPQQQSQPQALTALLRQGQAQPLAPSSPSAAPATPRPPSPTPAPRASAAVTATRSKVSLEDRWGRLEGRVANWTTKLGQQKAEAGSVGLRGIFGGSRSPSQAGSPTHAATGSSGGFGVLAELEERERQLRIQDTATASFGNPSSPKSPLCPCRRHGCAGSRVGSPASERRRGRGGDSPLDFPSPTASDRAAWHELVRAEQEQESNAQGTVLLERLKSVENSVQTISQVLTRASGSPARLRSASPVASSPPYFSRPPPTRPRSPKGCCDVCGLSGEGPGWLPEPRFPPAIAGGDDVGPSLMEQRVLALRRRQGEAPLPPMLGGTGAAWERAAYDAISLADMVYDDNGDEHQAWAATEQRHRREEQWDRERAHDEAWTQYGENTAPRKGRFRWPLDVMRESQDLRSATEAATAAAVAAASGRRGRGAGGGRGRYADILAAAVEA
mmetsp:Transcript_139483/g.446260  ORF Transcript_139483/g.446260 Transcript_139483/m.446260 type:complete len:569 (-) Transcript_139483:73-1779(-)